MCRSKKKVTCNAKVNDVVWFKGEMSKRLNKEIELNEIRYESILLEYEEFDEAMIPPVNLQLFSNSFLAHSVIYVQMKVMN